MVFITSFGEEMQARELCKFLKGKGKIRDIILPKRRDKNNMRDGFVMLNNEEEARKIIKASNGV